MPFKHRSVKAFFMIDVLHHIPDTNLFFKEIDRCLKPGGRVVMIEPANTLFGGLAYKYFHHEVSNPKGRWHSDIENPLFDANLAIPWIVFYRDRHIFEEKFSNLRIIRLFTHTPFRYHITGGASGRQLVPDNTYNLVKKIESILAPLNRYIGMFMTVELKKNESPIN